MYKSKLQELCQARRWSLPEYSMTREGFDHAPRFQACIVVNGVQFESSDLCKTSKQAQNEVARLAYEHFVRPVVSRSPNSTASSSSSPSSQGSFSTNVAMHNFNEKEVASPKNPETSPSPATHLNGSGIKDLMEHGEMQHIYKNSLQNYAQKRNFNLPTYSCKREGPPHAIRFKASVTVDGKTFESPEFFRTLKEAEHAAAKVALAALSEDGMQEQDPSLYKNLLQDLVHKEGFPLPNYVTARSGPPHLPTFICTVEIEGNSFQGIAAKTKKQAENNAAKVAYHSLQERRVSSQNSHAKETNACLSSSSIPIVIVDFEKGLEFMKTLNPTSSLKSFKHTEVADQEMHSAETIIAAASFSSQSNVADQEMHSAETIVASARSSSRSNEKLKTSSKSTSGKSSDEVYACLRDPFPSVGTSLEEWGLSASTDSECSEDVVTNLNDLNINLPTETSSLLRVNKVQVFPHREGMQLPDGTTVLPFSDDKWVAVSSDFPSHKIKE